MTKLASPILVLVVLTALLAGCGGGGSGDSSGGTAGKLPNGGGGVNGITVGNCLNQQYDFLVQPQQTKVDGQSPGGVTFTLTLFKSADLAKAAYVKKNPKTTSLVANGVVDFKGNPSLYKGAPPAKISKVELANINACIAKAKSS
jgi:hypothetical protein